MKFKEKKTFKERVVQFHSKYIKLFDVLDLTVTGIIIAWVVWHFTENNKPLFFLFLRLGTYYVFFIFAYLIDSWVHPKEEELMTCIRVFSRFTSFHLIIVQGTFLILNDAPILLIILVSVCIHIFFYMVYYIKVFICWILKEPCEFEDYDLKILHELWKPLNKNKSI